MTTDDGEISEFNSGNNAASVTVESLFKQADGQPTTVTSLLEQNETGSTATVTLQNNSMVQKTTGNVIVTLLDESGNMLEQKQSYIGGTEENNGLVTLGGEQRVTLPAFQFSETGTSVQVTYSDLILDADNADLDSLSFSNIPGIGLDSFTEDQNGIYRAGVSTDDLTSTTVMVASKSGLAKITLADGTGSGSNALSEKVTLTPGQTQEIGLAVTSEDGSHTKTYILTIQNNGDPVINWPDGGDAAGAEYGVEVYYAGEAAVINLTAAASGDYDLSYQWYSCEADGENRQSLEDETSATLTVPSNKDSGAYYYRCKVTRHLVNGGTKDYWSSVATVWINRRTATM